MSDKELKFLRGLEALRQFAMELYRIGVLSDKGYTEMKEQIEVFEKYETFGNILILQITTRVSLIKE